MGLTVDISKYKDSLLVKIAGNLMGNDSRNFKKKVETLYKKNPANIILDISNTKFVDSDGLGVIVYYHTLMNKTNGKLYLYNTSTDPDSYMNRLLEFTKLNKIFNVIHSLDKVESVSETE